MDVVCVLEGGLDDLFEFFGIQHLNLEGISLLAHRFWMQQFLGKDFVEIDEFVAFVDIEELAAEFFLLIEYVGFVGFVDY